MSKVVWSKKLEYNLKPFAGEFINRPTRALEIGVFKGYATKWFLENILQHPESRYVGIDPFDWRYTSHKQFPDTEEGKARWIQNLKDLEEMKKIHHPKVEFKKGFSQDILLHEHFYFIKEKFDIIHVDGHHTTMSVLRDFVLTWPILKIGGIMIFDDYIQRTTTEVKVAVDTILIALGERRLRCRRKEQLSPTRESYMLSKGLPRAAKYETLFNNFQYGIRKLGE